MAGAVSCPATPRRFTSLSSACRSSSRLRPRTPRLTLAGAGRGSQEAHLRSRCATRSSADSIAPIWICSIDRREARSRTCSWSKVYRVALAIDVLVSTLQRSSIGLFYLGALFYISWQLTLLVLALAGAIGSVLTFVYRRITQRGCRADRSEPPHCVAADAIVRGRPHRPRDEFAGAGHRTISMPSAPRRRVPKNEARTPPRCCSRSPKRWRWSAPC